jgi:UMF1 family MFS transporter
MNAPSRRERFAWCLFDFANSAFNTVITTFVYAWYFQQRLAPDATTGDVLWARTAWIGGLLLAVLAPVLGVVADRGRHRRAFLVGLSLATIALTTLLFLPQPGAGGAPGSAAALALAFWVVLAANVTFEATFVFYNSFLPGLGDERTIGRLSGYGWACGYAGGLLCLALCLLVVKTLPAEDSLNFRVTALVVAGWFLAFALPAFLWLRDRAPPAAGPARTSLRDALAGVVATLRGLRGRPDLARLLLGHLVYNDALMAVITLAALYMGDTLGMGATDVMLVAIGLNVVAGLGALAFGFVEDRVGGKTVLVASLLLLAAGALLAVSVPAVPAFLVAASLIGLGMGPNQSASRTLLGRFAEPEKSAELYGLFALSGKATVWLAPLSFSLIRDAGGSQRLALSPVIVLFAVGLWLVLGIDERRGVAAARAGRP